MGNPLERLVLTVPPLSEHCLCAEVYDRFADDEDLLVLAVTREDRPIGIVNRHELLFQLAHNFGRALFGKKPIQRLMDGSPLVVDVKTGLPKLNSTIVRERPSALLKGFIVTDQGRYLGVGTALSLMDLTVEHMEDRAKELTDARNRAAASSRSKSQFLASMSHELRTPLNAIIGFSDLIARQYLGPLGTERYREYAEDIRSSGTHLLGVINDVLDVAKIEAGRLRLNEIVLRPLDLVQKCVRLIEPSARDAGIRMSCRCDLKGSEIRADEVKLQQVLLNLLSNAVKFTPSGGEIRVEADVCMAKGLGIAISDTGIGIPEKDLERIFEPFEQVDSDKNRSFDGTGLGLYIAQALIDMHGGALTLHSAVRQGTTATVRLPSERLLVQAA